MIRIALPLATIRNDTSASELCVPNAPTRTNPVSSAPLTAPIVLKTYMLPTDRPVRSTPAAKRWHAMGNAAPIRVVGTIMTAMLAARWASARPAKVWYPMRGTKNRKTDARPQTPTAASRQP